MAWIESHDDLATHPKTRRAARALGISIPTMMGHLHLLWHWCLKYADDGNLSGYDHADIADAMMWDGDPDELADALVNCGPGDRHGFLERDGDDRLVVCGWRGGRVTPRHRNEARRHWESISRRIRPVILERDGFTCQWCGQDDDLEIDHIIPLARGGTNDPHNLQVLCRPCNRRKGAKLWRGSRATNHSQGIAKR